MKKKTIQKYHNIHYKKPIAVLGGGPNLISDLKLLPKEIIKISVNSHAQKFIDCEYLTFLDDPEKLPSLLNILYWYKGVKVTPGNEQKYSDVLFINFEYPLFYLTSTFATWFAGYLGGSPIILCGMDLFQNKYQSHYGAEIGVEYGNIDLMTLDDHKKPWLKQEYINKDNIYVCSGPLIGIFKKWKRK